MKIFIKFCLFFFITLSLNSSFAQNTRKVDYFNKVSASASVKVKLIKSDEQRVEYKMLKGDEDRLITEVKNDRLIVKIKNKAFNWNNNTKAAVKVYYTELEAVSASAGATVKAEEPITGERVDVEVSSGAVMDVEVEASKVKAEASSGSRLLIEGSAEKGAFEVSSGANIDAVTLVCDNVKAEANSGGRMKVHANKKLHAEANSGGSIRYKGNADYVDSDSGWSGKVKKIN